MKNFLSYFNIFELNLTSTSYKSPIIRIIVSLIVLLSIFFFRISVTIESVVINIFLTILLLAIMVLSVLCLFIASVECLQVGDNIRREKARQEDYKKKSGK